MKVGAAVLGIHVAALCAFSLSQGCVTTESQGSGRGAGAHHRGPWSHQHKGKSAPTQEVAQEAFYPGADDGTGSVYEPVIVESSNTSVEPYVAPVGTAGTEVYIVQKGDVLSRVAVDFNTTTKNLIAMNNLSNPDVLYVGQELRVPAGGKRASNSSAATKTSSIKRGGSYEIQKGDTLSGIAVAAGVSINDLRSLNNIQGDRIVAGEKIDIPSYGKVPSTTQKSTTKKKTEPAPVEPAAAEPAPAPLAAAPMVEPVETATMEVEHVVDHVVYPGETIDDISRQYGVSKSDIMRLNNISDAAAVKEGQRLRIPISE